MWGRKCDAFFQSTGRLTSLPGSFGTCTNLNQTIISRQLGALITPARLAERPEWSETAVSAQEGRASGAAATTPPVNQ
jgi:hypothetical protein